MPRISTIGTAKPIRRLPAPTTPIRTAPMQRAGVVELVEPGDHGVHPHLPGGGAEAGLGAGDPGRRGEAERRDHGGAGAEQGEAEDGHLPGGGEHHDRQATPPRAPRRPAAPAPRRTPPPPGRRPAGPGRWPPGRGTSPARPAPRGSGRCRRGTSVPRSPRRCRPCRRARARRRPAAIGRQGTATSLISAAMPWSRRTNGRGQHHQRQHGQRGRGLEREPGGGQGERRHRRCRRPSTRRGTTAGSAGRRRARGRRPACWCSRR